MFVVPTTLCGKRFMLVEDRFISGCGSFSESVTLRDVAQMVERRVRDAEVASSNLVIPSGGENKYTFPNEVSVYQVLQAKMVIRGRHRTLTVHILGGANGTFNHSLGDSDLGYTLIQA